MDYKPLAKEILKNIGTKSNVRSITHCVTRVRFVLNDESQANDEVIRDLDGVLDVVKQGGQYQVVIGPSVGSVYDAIIDVANFSDNVINSSEIAAPTSDETEEKGFLNKALGLISSIFIPVLGLLSGAGMIKAILSLCTVIGLLTAKSGTYIILSALGDTLFYFFPIVVGWSAARKFGLKEIYGVTLGAFLVYPTLATAASSTAVTTIFKGTIFALKYKMTFLGIPVALQSYSSTVIPIIIIVWFASYVYAPVAGESFDLTTVHDDVFSKLVLGDGIAVKPSDGKVYAPVTGIVRVAYPTGHAVGLASDDGEEVLIHIGIDTVNLEGKHFKMHVAQGMRVKKGDLLVDFDEAAISAAGYDTTVMMVVTKSERLKSVMPTQFGPVTKDTKVLDVELQSNSVESVTAVATND
ncbi:glucose PTS transporter subunit IIA [Lactiplantibacillus plantarum]|uniref:glucose PTS transporter subunit IIA n=1 Tax=Lactiplantibacillus plantarum TaxID=1590 RepID=UPI0010822010|nr:glucose PTS transporter subunit IIA [Lactiplantibacillus plantarum]QBX93284.1 hypothetical protein DVH03_02500 [Lactiplantibacillus plantarum]